MDEALLAYPVIDVGMIVRRACPDAFELGNANPDLRETSIVFEFDIIVSHPVHVLLWRAVWNQGRRATISVLISTMGLARLRHLLALWASMIAAVGHHHICVDTNKLTCGRSHRFTPRVGTIEETGRSWLTVSEEAADG